jgi:hypothetical protein
VGEWARRSWPRLLPFEHSLRSSHPMQVTRIFPSFDAENTKVAVSAFKSGAIGAEFDAMSCAKSISRGKVREIEGRAQFEHLFEAYLNPLPPVPHAQPRSRAEGDRGDHA